MIIVGYSFGTSPALTHINSYPLLSTPLNHGSGSAVGSGVADSTECVKGESACCIHALTHSCMHTTCACTFHATSTAIGLCTTARQRRLDHSCVLISHTTLARLRFNQLSVRYVSRPHRKPPINVQNICAGAWRSGRNIAKMATDS